MSRMSNLHAIQDDVPPSHLPDDSDWDAPPDPFFYGDNPTLCARIRKHAGNDRLPYEVRCTLYLAAERIEWLAGQVQQAK
jgi:hypothetical protein